MTFKFLPSTFNDVADDAEVYAGSSAAGYSVDDLCGGPRNRVWQSAAAFTAIQPILKSDDTVALDHAVIVRADKLVTKSRAKVNILTSTNTTGDLTSVDETDPLTENDLVGPYAQDYVAAITTGNAYRVGLSFLTHAFNSLVAWFKDGDTGVTADSANRVSAWADQSGASNNATQSTDGLKPIVTRADNYENKITQSEDITSSDWTKTRSSTADAAGHWIAGAGNYSNNGIEQSYVTRSYWEESCTFSVWLKKDNYDHFWIGSIGSNNKGCRVNLDTHTIYANAYASAASVMGPDADGYYLYEFTFSSQAWASGSEKFVLYLHSGTGTDPAAYNAAGTEAVYCRYMGVRSASSTGSVINTTTAPQLRGVNGRKVLWFDGTDDYLACDGLVSTFNGSDTATTTFLVLAPAPQNASNDWFALNDNGGAALQIYRVASSTYKFETYKRDSAYTMKSQSVNSALTANMAQVVCISVAGTTATVYKNNALIGSENFNFDVNSVTFTKGTLGAWRYSSIVNYARGKLCEMLVFNAALTESERTHVYNYLAARWLGSTYTSDNLYQTSEACQIGNLFFSQAFDFGVDPIPGVAWEAKEDNTSPLYSEYGSYKTEAVIELTFQGVTQAKAEAFKKLFEIMKRPLFLYDADQCLWAHKLEHVLIENWSEVVLGKDNHVFTIRCRRLKHYN